MFGCLSTDVTSDTNSINLYDEFVAFLSEQQQQVVLAWQQVYNYNIDRRHVKHAAEQ